MKSGKDMVSVLPKSWALADLGSIRQNFSKSVNPSKFPGQIFELYSVPSFHNGHPEIVSGNQIASSKQTVDEGTVLLCKINPRINRSWVVQSFSKYPKIASTEWIPFFKQDGIDPKFLCYFMQTNTFRDFLASNVSGVGGSLMRVKPSTFSTYPFPLPPLPEQHRIVSKIEELFTKLDAGIEELRKANARLRRYRQAVLTHAFRGNLTKEWRDKQRSTETPTAFMDRMRIGCSNQYIDAPVSTSRMGLHELPNEWLWARMESIGNVTGGVTKNSKRQSYSKQFPYLRVANVYAGQLRLDEVLTIGVSERELERVLLQKSDLLVVEGNGSIDQIGRVAIWDGSISPCVHQNHLIKVRFHKSAMAKYALYWLLSGEGRKHITQVASSTSGLHTLSISKVEALPVPLCSPNEQEQIVQEIERHLSLIEKTEEIIDHELIQSHRLRQGILFHAFSGRLIPQDPNDEPAEKLLERIRESAIKVTPTKKKRKSNGDTPNGK